MTFWFLLPRTLAQPFLRLQCLVWLHCRWRKGFCTNWTWYNGGCWGLLLVGFAYLMNLGKAPWGEWTKEWNTLRFSIHCRRGAINILKTNTAWQRRLLPLKFLGLLQPLLGCLCGLGAQPSIRTIQNGIKHSLRFHVHIMANETGGWQPKLVCNQWLLAVVKYCESMRKAKGSPCPLSDRSESNGREKKKTSHKPRGRPSLPPPAFHAKARFNLRLSSKTATSLTTFA